MANVSVAGDLTGFERNHPDLGMYGYDPVAGEDSMYSDGGPVSDDDDSAITANGNMIDKMNAQRPSFTCTLRCVPGDGVLESLRAEQASTKLGTYTATHINGTIYRIKGKPVGRLEMNGNTGRITVKIGGAGKIEII